MAVSKGSAIGKLWLQRFQGLKFYSNGKLYQVLGPAISGLELIRLPFGSGYRPHFVVYPLWRGDLKICLKYPVFMCEFYDLRGRQFNLPFEDPNEKYKAAQEIIFKEVGKMLGGDFDFVSCEAMISEFPMREPTYGRHPARFVELLELRLSMALYVDDTSTVSRVLSEIKKFSRSSDLKVMHDWFGDFDQWMTALERRVENPGDFLGALAENRGHPKIARLMVSEIR